MILLIELFILIQFFYVILSDLGKFWGEVYIKFAVELEIFFKAASWGRIPRGKVGGGGEVEVVLSKGEEVLKKIYLLEEIT